MNEINWLNIIKWVLIVLLAGFIGQFGKSFAKHMMEKARLKRGNAVESKTEAVIPQDRLEEADSYYDHGKTLSSEQAKDIAKQEKKKEAKNLEKEGK